MTGSAYIPADAAARRRLLPAAATFAFVALAAPVVEICAGAAPWPGADAATKFGVLDGGLFRAVERAQADRSVVAATARPAYLEAVHALFGATNEKLVAGKDRWLFLRETSLDYPGRGGDEKVRAHAELIGRLAAWWRERGTLLLAVPVPNKETLYPEKLPPHARVRPMLPVLLEALAAVDAPHVDLRPALDPAAGLTFLPNDSHWSSFGARRAAEAVADGVRARLRGAVPGDPVEAAFDVEPEKTHFGDLQRMLGFRPGSAAEAAFGAPTRWVAARRTDGGALTVDAGAPIVVCGTSFSHSFGWAKLVAAALGRVVVDATVAGKGPTLRLLELAEKVRGGQVAAPALIVWEFPEKHLFTRPFEFLLPLKDFVREAGAGAAFDLAAAAPLAVRDRRIENVDLADGGDGATVRGVGRPASAGGRPDPYVIYACGDPPPADGSAALEIVVRTAAPTALKIFLDYGAGKFDEATAVVRRTAPAGAPTRCLLPLVDPAAGASLRRVRVDPTNDATPFEIDPPRLVPRKK